MPALTKPQAETLPSTLRLFTFRDQTAAFNALAIEDGGAYHSVGRPFAMTEQLVLSTGHVVLRILDICSRQFRPTAAESQCRATLSDHRLCRNVCVCFSHSIVFPFSLSLARATEYGFSSCFGCTYVLLFMELRNSSAL